MILARETSEALLVVRVGSVVYKLLRPLDGFARHPNDVLRATPEQRLAQLLAQADESLTPPCNPRLYVPELSLIVSPWVDGREATPDEKQALANMLARQGRSYIQDLSDGNARMTDRGPVLVDWLMCIPSSRNRSTHS